MRTSFLTWRMNNFTQGESFLKRKPREITSFLEPKTEYRFDGRIFIAIFAIAIVVFGMYLALVRGAHADTIYLSPSYQHVSDYCIRERMNAAENSYNTGVTSECGK